MRGMQYAYIGRKLRKRDFRRLWIQRINAAARERGLSYSQLMGGLARAEVAIDRRTMADLAISDPAAFDEFVEIARGEAVATS
jgi:large subunit ribosomal protein L20